jgi:hypothetical protein
VSDALAWLEPAGVATLLADIHGTVDLDRALVEHGLDVQSAREATDDPLLGARVVIAAGRLTSIAIAEPSTEGRLAGALARHGEGVVGRYLAAPAPLDEVRRLAADAGVRLSATQSGPFGDELLVLEPRIGARLVILVDPGRVPSAR